MKRIILKTSIILTLASSTVLANESFINSVGLNLGKAYSTYDQKDKNGSIILGNTPDKTFNSIEVFSTLNPISEMCKKYNMKPYVSYTYSKNDELKHQYLLVGINKYYTPNNTKVNLYAGVVGGYGQLNWRYDPVNNSVNKNVDANSIIGGMQIGIEYPIKERFSLNINGKYLIHNYNTNIKTNNANSTIEHKSTNSMSIGLQYTF